MMVDSFVDHEALDWSRVVAAAYRIDQTIRYEYATPIRHLRHRLVIAPRAVHGDQRRLSRSLIVSPDAASQLQVDAFGNDVDALEVPYVERSIAFALRSSVVRDARLGLHADEASALTDPALRDQRRRLTRPDAALEAAAARLRERHGEPHALAEAIGRYVYGEMVYTKGATDVFTTAAQAFALRRGVCQDYAHVAIALARACGISARYVSGHLLGEGATHAWIELLLPTGRGARVLSFDPTHGRPTNLRYLVIAVGRDYEDVAPTSGVFTGSAPGRIGAQQVVRVTDVTLAA